MSAAEDGGGQSRALAGFVVGLRPSDVPDRTLERASLLLADALGAGLHGSRTEVGALVWEHARRTSLPGPAPVWGRPGGLVAEAAALVNGTQVHAYELDDYHAGAKLHPGSVVAPALLAAAAAAPHPVPGRDLLTALVVGYEVAVRVSLAAGSAAVRRRGWHLTGVAGPLGAAAAVARVTGLDEATALAALGIAGSHAGGLFAFSREGAMTKRLHAGLAARSGVASAALAAAGVTGPSDVLEAADGGLLAALSDEADPARLTADLGAGFLLDEVSVKPYACCGSLHSSVDAVLRLAAEHDLAPEDVARVTARNAALVDRQCGFEYRGGGGGLEAQMSLQYCLAVALTDRACSPAQFTAERRADPRVRALAGRVAFALDHEIDAVYPRRFPARVEVLTRAGTVLEASVDDPTGSPHAPLGWEDVVRKLTATTAGVLDDDARAALVDALAGLPGRADARDLVPRTPEDERP